MFSEPAVITLSMVSAAAGPGPEVASRPTAADAITTPRGNLILNLPCHAADRFRPARLLSLLLQPTRWVEVQRVRRQADADGRARREPPLVIDEVLLPADRDSVAIEPAGIGALPDPAAQDQAVRRALALRDEPRGLAPEVHHRAVFDTVDQ